MRGERRLRFGVLAGLRGRRPAGERPRTGEQLVRDDGQRVAVAGGGRGTAERLLGRQVRGGPEHLAVLRHLRVIRQSRDAEVADREAIVRVEQEVRGLDVAMDDPRGVGDVQPGRGLSQPAQRRRDGHPLAGVARGSQPIGHRSAAEVLHDDEGVVAVLADVVDRHDVPLVAHLRGRARLALKPGASTGVGGELRAEHLHGDEAAEQKVLGLPHRGHSAAGDMANDAVALRQGDGRGERHVSPDGYPADRPLTRRAGRPSTLLDAMAKVCHSCGKKPAFGQSRSHSMVATKRRFNPNLQKVRVLIAGAPRRVYVCTRCLKAGKVTKAA